MGMKIYRIRIYVLLCAGVSLLHASSASCTEQREGKATVYSNSFSGKKTATGEKYKKDAMTAASPSLPLGSKVLVKNKATGKSAVVKVNDRQPKGGGKVVDLSKTAANKLGVKGTAPVKAKVLSKKQ
jgi:rare lipoprotein A